MRLITVSLYLSLSLSLSVACYSQSAMLQGKIYLENAPCHFCSVISTTENSHVMSDEKGFFTISIAPNQLDTVTFSHIGYQTEKLPINRTMDMEEVAIHLRKNIDKQIETITVLSTGNQPYGRTTFDAIDNFTVFEGKKNEIILLKNLTINTATNNSRQLFAQITGLNIWESDGAGLQLGIGGRGLNPNRTSNFNTRQNGYDISADALGYPESYYTPVSDILHRIDVIRGASALQFGTQFGGVVNFIYKRPSDRNIAYETKQSLGSWKFASTYHELSGTINNGQTKYLAMYQYKRGDGYRPNSQFDVQHGFAQLQHQWTQRWKTTLEWSYMHYLTQQAGGLTDASFRLNPRLSFRNRNWFEVNWSLMAMHNDIKVSDKTVINNRTFGLLADRSSLGNLDKINVVDFNQNRTLIFGKFANIGHESRIISRFVLGEKQVTSLSGIRLYRGTSEALQGEADQGSGPTFQLISSDSAVDSDYDFVNFNGSVFNEWIIKIMSNTTITPGIRYEYIKTISNGYYRNKVYDFAGNQVAITTTYENLQKPRSLVIAGVGISHDLDPYQSLYANVTQNYRAINFTDLRINNPNVKIDTNLTDEKGFSADIGWKYKKHNWNVETTLFFLKYNNRIGQILHSGQAPLYQDFRLRTNIASSYNVGIESSIQGIVYTFAQKSDLISIFGNVSITRARYASKDKTIHNKNVEMVPPFIIRSGANLSLGRFKASAQYSYTYTHYTDASNAKWTASAVEGLIPSYQVVDLTMQYQLNKWLTVESSVNNALNAKYFTRRADSYPGPGLIPSDGRAVFITLGAKF